ncbi:SRPBCC family protein [Gordonia sp. HY285]|uniref:SRPBCC family protein n=1 Tax=Gordonia liuliyuniae TaxID=2911517 RepID=UPI001F41CE0E|nr:SRPBCC family protein [Gordonia liuliyuniae]MCF8611679.1 SRPBCC family protein [Gordonia liuliyuniae]
MTGLPPDRELHAETTVHATPDRVWSVLSDPATMRTASPELFATSRTRRGPLRVGETFIGWNRNGLVVWPTVNKVTEVEPGRKLAWFTRTSGATWTYTLTGDGTDTIVHESRRIDQAVSRTAKVFAAVFLGGLAKHADELDEHVAETLEAIRQMSESGGKLGSRHRLRRAVTATSLNRARTS